jgi:hypothetical protein
MGEGNIGYFRTPRRLAIPEAPADGPAGRRPAGWFSIFTGSRARRQHILYQSKHILLKPLDFLSLLEQLGRVLSALGISNLIGLGCRFENKRPRCAQLMYNEYARFLRPTCRGTGKSCHRQHSDRMSTIAHCQLWLGPTIVGLIPR